MPVINHACCQPLCTGLLFIINEERASWVPEFVDYRIYGTSVRAPRGFPRHIKREWKVRPQALDRVESAVDSISSR